MDSPILGFQEYISKDEHQHLLVFLEAYDLFAERSTSRGDMWRHFPISDKIRELRERVSRIEMAKNMMHYVPQGRDPDKHRDTMRREIRAELIDILNYATFAVKQIDEDAAL